MALSHMYSTHARLVLGIVFALTLMVSAFVATSGVAEANPQSWTPGDCIECGRILPTPENAPVSESSFGTVVRFVVALVVADEISHRAGNRPIREAAVEVLSNLIRSGQRAWEDQGCPDYGRLNCRD